MSANKNTNMFEWNLLLGSRKLHKVESRKSTSMGVQPCRVYRGKRRRALICVLLILFYFASVPLHWRTRALNACTIPELKRYFVTAASISHFESCVELLRTINPNFGDIAYVVYGLNLGYDERVYLKDNFPWVEVRSFNFTNYPSFAHIDVAFGQFAWKPMLIEELVARTGADTVVWMDSGNRIIESSQLYKIFHRAETFGFITTITSGSTQQWVHPNTAHYLNAHGMNLKMCNGALIAFSVHNTRAWTSTMQPWFACARTLSCIAPSGSNRLNHRQDQAALTVLAHKAGFTCETPWAEHEAINLYGQYVSPESAVLLHRDGLTHRVSVFSGKKLFSCGQYYDASSDSVMRFNGIDPCLGFRENRLKPHFFHQLPNKCAGVRSLHFLVLFEMAKSRANADVSVVLYMKEPLSLMKYQLRSMFTHFKGSWELILVANGQHYLSPEYTQTQALVVDFESSDCVRMRFVWNEVAACSAAVVNTAMLLSDSSNTVVILRTQKVFRDDVFVTSMGKLHSSIQKAFCSRKTHPYQSYNDSKTLRCSSSPQIGGTFDVIVAWGMQTVSQKLFDERYYCSRDVYKESLFHITGRSIVFCDKTVS